VLLAGLAILVVPLLLTACAPSDPPPTSPLDEDPGTSAPGASTPLPTFTASPDLTASATATSSVTPTSDASAEAEQVTGEAIARLAEWIGAPETEFRLTSIEAVDWPDACLGIENPAIACAEVITPGYRVTLHHVAAPNSPYLVHASEGGRYSWAPSRGPVPRTVESVNADAGTVRLESLDASEDHMGTLQRTVPGSFLEVPLRELEPGQRVVIGTADPLNGADAGLIVLLVPIDE